MYNIFFLRCTTFGNVSPIYCVNYYYTLSQSRVSGIYVWISKSKLFGYYFEWKRKLQRPIWYWSELSEFNNISIHTFTYYIVHINLVDWCAEIFKRKKIVHRTRVTWNIDSKVLLWLCDYAKWIFEQQKFRR